MSKKTEKKDQEVHELGLPVHEHELDPDTQRAIEEYVAFHPTATVTEVSGETDTDPLDVVAVYQEIGSRGPRYLDEMHRKYGICSADYCAFPIAGWIVGGRKLCLYHLVIEARTRDRISEVPVRVEVPFRHLRELAAIELDLTAQEQGIVP